MSTQQECPECPDNGNLSWQEPAVIQLCYESEVFGACTPGTGNVFGLCEFGPDAQQCSFGNVAFG